MTTTPDFGALVISLDFELSWGVRDFLLSNPAYTKNIKGEGKAVSAILNLFEEFEIAATWATVGLIFANSADDATDYLPSVLPEYNDPDLSPYGQLTAPGFEDDCCYAPALIDRIKQTPRQEIATHTFSHFYCLEPGQTPEAFAADIDSAVTIAKNKGVSLRSIVFPRNQHNPQYDHILSEKGIGCYRGNQKARMYQFDRKTLDNKFFRISRLLDTYVNVSGTNTVKWTDLKKDGMVDVPASIFLRPVRRKDGILNDLQRRRITSSMREAAKYKKIFHLWWHPHNFGELLEENLAFLTLILDEFKKLNREFGMRSLTMSDAASLVSSDQMLQVNG